jgi:hypothetical protein
MTRRTKNKNFTTSAKQKTNIFRRVSKILGKQKITNITILLENTLIPKLNTNSIYLPRKKL